MTDTARTLADDLEAILRNVTGVTAIYPTAPIPAVIVGEMLATTALPVTAPHLITVSADEEGTTVTALIGVTDSAPAHETGLAAHTQIADYLNRTQARANAVTVRIGMVGS